MKNLKKLENDGLLRSKSYGLAKEKFWFLAKHPIVSELEYIPPKKEVHAFKYDHEKDCAEVFVSLALTDSLFTWEGEGDQKSGLRHDRKFSVDDRVFCLEVERGTQGDGRLREKLARYVKYYESTREPFHVLFTVQNESAIESLVYLFGEFKLGNQYGAVLFQDFINDPLNAPITTRFDTLHLSKHLSKQLPNE